MNQLTNLHRWAHRQDENFMTEAFVYLLGYLVKNEPVAAMQVFRDLTEGRINGSVDDCQYISISTQKYTDQGRPDIEIRTPSIIAYVEVKSESGLEDTQLKRYRTALGNSGYDITFLCLLTRYPVEDGAGVDKPDISLRWLQIYDFLDKLCIKDSVCQYVVKEFMAFLERKGIVIEKVDWQLVDGVKALQNLLGMLGKAIESNGIKTKPLSGGKEYIGYHTDDKKNWIGICYEKPQILQFEIILNKALSKKDLNACGLTENGANSDPVCDYVDLSIEENHFFSRDKTSQLRFLETKIGAWRKCEQKIRKLGY